MPAILPARRGPGGDLRADTERVAGAPASVACCAWSRCSRRSRSWPAARPADGRPRPGPGTPASNPVRGGRSTVCVRPAPTPSVTPGTPDGTLSSTELGLVYQFILQRYVDKVDHAVLVESAIAAVSETGLKSSAAAARSRPDRPAAAADRRARPRLVGVRAWLRCAGRQAPGVGRAGAAGLGRPAQDARRRSTTITRCSWSRRRCGG